MIDIENLVFDTVCTAVLSVFPTAYVVGEEINVPQSMPCVSLVMSDNTVYERSQDENTENHANVTFTVNVYSNKQNGKKGEAKQIADIVDSAMQGMKFTRRMLSPVPNADEHIYRITARYAAVVEAGKATGQDTVYQIYRR